jgi:phage-related protein
MTEDPVPQKIPVISSRPGKRTEPGREWLRELPEGERQAVGKDLLRATPDEDLALARKRRKELLR